MTRQRLTCVAVIAALAALPLALALACSCGPPPPPLEALARAALVVEVELRPGRTVSDDHMTARYRFEVLRVWKGEPVGTLTIETPTQSSLCGKSYEASETWLLYLPSASDGVVSAPSCGRGLPSEKAADDLRALGEPRWTAPGYEALPPGPQPAGGAKHDDRVDARPESTPAPEPAPTPTPGPPEPAPTPTDGPAPR
jgi:hypothetical protein